MSATVLRQCGRSGLFLSRRSCRTLAAPVRLRPRRGTPVTNTVEIKLGPWDEMADLFSWDPSSGIDLRDLIAHGINQTMQRDGLVGSWADVYRDSGDTLSVKVSAPFEKVTGYATMIPAFIDAARVGYSAYMAHRAT